MTVSTATATSPTRARERAAAAASIHAARQTAARCRRASAHWREWGATHPGHTDSAARFAEQELRAAELWDTEAANLAVTYRLPLDVDPLDLVHVTVESGWTLGGAA